MNTREAMESKVMVGSEKEMAGVMGKSKETVGLEAKTMAGMESGVDTAAGMDSESTVDQSGAVAGAKASARCTIVTAGGDAGVDLRLTVAGTAAGDGAVVVPWMDVRTIAETIPSVFVVASEFTAPTNVWLGTAGAETERVG